MSFLLASLPPRASSSTPSLLLAPARRLKSKRPKPVPSRQFPVVNADRARKYKQMKVMLHADLANFGKAGDVVSANRTHALQLSVSNTGSPISTSFYGQPAIFTDDQPSVHEALFDPSMAAILAERVPAFRFFSTVDRAALLVSHPGPVRKVGGRPVREKKEGVWGKGMPSTTGMARVLAAQAQAKEARLDELRSLGWRPEEVNEYEEEDEDAAWDALEEDEVEAVDGPGRPAA